MNEIVLDTETTGLSVKEGHRIVEIGCIELKDLIPTKKVSFLFKSRKKSFRESFRSAWIADEFYLPKKFRNCR